MNPPLTNHIFSDSVSKMSDNFENFGSILSFSENFEIFYLPRSGKVIQKCFVLVVVVGMTFGSKTELLFFWFMVASLFVF